MVPTTFENIILFKATSQNFRQIYIIRRIWSKLHICFQWIKGVYYVSGSSVTLQQTLHGNPNKNPITVGAYLQKKWICGVASKGRDWAQCFIEITPFMFTLLRLIVFSATYAGMLVHVKEDTGHIWFFTADTRSTPVSADSSLSKYIFSFFSRRVK